MAAEAELASAEAERLRAQLALLQELNNRKTQIVVIQADEIEARDPETGEVRTGQPPTPPPTPTTRPPSDEVEIPCDHCITNAWLFVPGGTFKMGDIWGDGDDDETPVHNVTLSDFYLHKYEVTFAEYDKCIQAGVCEESRFDDNDNYDQPNKPVNGVDWQDAMDYCQWIGGDLPTEAQWEYAASWGTGDTHQKFKWALDKEEFDEDNYCYDADSTCEIGSFAANGLGIYDLSGNVWEWCKDWYQSNWYSDPASRNRDPLCNNDTSGDRVIRGGSWYYAIAYILRSTDRYRVNPADRRNYLGFRCASLLQD